MAKRWAKAPSPCIDICKFRDGGRCIGCTMTKKEKKAFKRLDDKPAKKAFFAMLVDRLEARGRFRGWAKVYRRKCEKKAQACPLDKLDTPPEAAPRKRGPDVVPVKGVESMRAA